MAIDIGTMAQSAVAWATMALAIGVGLGMTGGSVWFYFFWRKYTEFKCIIWEKDGFGQLNERYDKAGIFVDGKTKNKRFFLKKANVGLDPDNVPYLPTRGKKVVYLLRTGLKNFHFIRPTVSNPNIYLSVGEEDVNWAINAYDRQKKLFDQSMFMQYLPFMMLAFVSIIILVMFIYFFKEFDTLKDVAIALKEAALATRGTVIT